MDLSFLDRERSLSLEKSFIRKRWNENDKIFENQQWRNKRAEIRTQFWAVGRFRILEDLTLSAAYLSRVRVNKIGLQYEGDWDGRTFITSNARPSGWRDRDIR